MAWQSCHFPSVFRRAFLDISNANRGSARLQIRDCDIMITLRGKPADLQIVLDALNLEESYPNSSTLTTAYAAIEVDGSDSVLVLPDTDETRVKKHGKGKIEKGDTRAKKAFKL